ncbi:hypothetical protein GALMADRAFT_215031 [Galerina marginata CBS 339.88]|uniref:Uncharacterized protein n=1 Tax=Galerina marginata (strain CBS 339.88) TaxID=685588 RepID=A0A067SFH3_GALM3|nr:hypothetical protein GALMADRAFT_215031 [Galerina marginata CBS 339.88]
MAYLDPAALHSALVELAVNTRITNLSTVSPGDRLSEMNSCRALPVLLVLGPMVLWITADTLLLIRLRAIYADTKQAFKWMLIAWLMGATFYSGTTSVFIRYWMPGPNCGLSQVEFDENRNFYRNLVSLGSIRFGAIMSALIADGILYYIGLVGGFYSFATCNEQRPRVVIVEEIQNYDVIDRRHETLVQSKIKDSWSILHVHCCLLGRLHSFWTRLKKRPFSSTQRLNG